MTLREAFEKLSGVKVTGDVKGVSTDTRTIREGEAFVAIRGEKFDGNHFVNEAMMKGASVVVTEDSNVSATSSRCTLIRVKDSLRFMCQLARLYRRNARSSVIGITGSVGKTTLKELISAILSEKFSVHSARKSYNNFIGVSLTLLNAPRDAKFIITELGTNAPGEIKALTRIARPDVGIITSAGPSHLEGLKSVKKVVDEKMDLFRGMKVNSDKLANGDISALRKKAYEEGMNITWFGEKRINDIFLCDARVKRYGIDFVIKGYGMSFSGEMRGFYHPAYAISAVPAVYIAVRAGVKEEDIKRVISEFSPVEGRGVLRRVKKGLYLYEDWYNANPISFKIAIEAVSNVLRAFQLSFPIAVVGDMLELGNLSLRYHRTVFNYFIQHGFKEIYAVGKWWAKLKDRLNSTALKCFEDPEEAGRACAENIRKYKRSGGACVLIKGSRRLEMERAVKYIQEA